jgi:hypothetical protein
MIGYSLSYVIPTAYGRQVLSGVKTLPANSRLLAGCAGSE